MTPEREYKQVFETQVEIDAFEEEMIARRKAACEYYDALFGVAQRLERKRLGKRGSSAVVLSDEVVEDMRQQTFKQFPGVDTLHEKLAAMRETRERKLNGLADKVRLRAPSKGGPVGQEADRCGLHSFSTQTQPSFYARASLLPLMWKLESLGFKCALQGPQDQVCGTWILWSNAEPWQVDCAKRQLTIEEALKAMGRIANPKVIYSGLFPDRLFDWHYANSGAQYVPLAERETNENQSTKETSSAKSPTARHKRAHPAKAKGG
jgi:hypothetical protein